MGVRRTVMMMVDFLACMDDVLAVGLRAWVGSIIDASRNCGFKSVALCATQSLSCQGGLTAPPRFGPGVSE